MKQQVAAGILALSVLGGVGTGVVANELRPQAGPETPVVKRLSAATAEKAEKKEKSSEAPAKQNDASPPKVDLKPLSSLQILTSSVGPVGLGMSKSDAVATGYVDADVNVPACGPGVELVHWKPAYSGALSLGYFDDGQIADIGVLQPGPRTRSGLQVGSTYASVRAVLGEGVTPVPVGNNQTGLMVSEGSNWMGFLFDPAPEAITEDATVKMIEVRLGARPNLIPYSC